MELHLSERAAVRRSGASGKTLADCRRRRAESSLMMKQKVVFC
jgi:hypothetical protein